MPSIHSPTNACNASRSSQQRVAERALDQRAAGPHRLLRAGRLQARVDLDQVHGHQAARLGHALADVVALAQRQAAAHGRAGAGRPLRIQRVDVEGQVDGRVGADVAERHLHDAADAVPAQHGESVLVADEDGVASSEGRR